MLYETYCMKVCLWEYQVSSNIRNSFQSFIQQEYQMLNKMLDAFAWVFSGYTEILR